MKKKKKKKNQTHNIQSIKWNTKNGMLDFQSMKHKIVIFSQDNSI